jgi:hypothetical protein
MGHEFSKTEKAISEWECFSFLGFYFSWMKRRGH